MTIPTITLSVVVAAITGSALPNAKVALTLTRADIVNGPGGALVPAGRTVIQCDAAGLGSGAVFPNALGTQGTGYLVEVFTEQGALAFSGRASIPNQDCKLHDVLFTIPPMQTTDADAAVLKARAWASQDTTPVETTPTPLYSAKYYALQASTAGSAWALLAQQWATFTGGDVPGQVAGSRSSKSWSQDDLRGATYGGSSRDWAMGAGFIDGVTYKSARSYALDGATSAGAAAGSAGAAAGSATAAAASASQTALDRAQADADVVTTGGARDTALGAAMTATAQAALASVMALSAASVTQQDLTGVQVAALHRSPNAVVQAFSYDTRKDSNPNWIRQCANTSWENEPLAGPWIPVSGQSGIPSEVVARAKGGTLGTETVANGASGFSSTTGYTGSGATLSVVGGRLRVTSTGGACEARSTITTVVGQAYLMEVEGYAAGLGGSLVARAGTTAGGSDLANVNVSSGTLFAVFVATGVTTNLTQTQSLSTAGTFSDFGKVSVRPITAFAVSSSYFQLSTDGKHYRLYRNLLANTEDLTNTTQWPRTNGTGGMTVTGGQADSNGGNAAFKIVPDAAGVGKYLNTSGLTLPALIGVPFTFWGKIKADGFNYCQISGSVSGAGFGFAAVLDLTGAGAVSSSSGTDLVQISIAAVPNQAGWFVYSVTGTAAAARLTFQPFFRPFVTSVLNATGDGVSGVRLFQPQMEIGSFTASQLVAAASTYEPKTGADTTQTEVTRGNKRQFPVVPSFVVEGLRVAIYDALEPGRPMWAVLAAGFWGSPTQAVNIIIALGGNTLTGAAFSNGVLSVCASNNTNLPLAIINFPRDAAAGRDSAGSYVYKGNIAQRHAGLGYFAASGGGLNGGLGNAVAMAVLPDAPIDPSTALAVPTIAVATNAGMALLKHDGTTVLSASTGNFKSVALNQYMLCANATTSQFFTALAPASLGAGFAFSVVPMAGGLFNGLSSPSNPMGRRGRVAQFLIGQPELQLAVLNESSLTSSLFARIRDAGNTGITVGDIRRAWMCDVSAGVASGANSIVNGDFATDISGWTGQAGVTISWNAGELQGVTTATASIGAFRDFVTIPGETYNATLTMRGNGGAPVFAIYDGPLTTLLVTTAVPFTSDGVNHTGTVTFKATSASTRVIFGYAGTVGVTYFADNVSCAQVVVDRSYKNKPLTVFGTLTKTAVAAGSQLVAYSGFSASNYAQEAYSADHDYGTGPWLHAPACSIPALTQGNATFSPFFTLPLANFGVAQNIALTMNTAQWTKGTGWTCPAANSFTADGTAGAASSDLVMASSQTPGTGAVRKWTLVVTALTLNGGGVAVYPNNGAPFNITATGTYTGVGNVGGANCVIRVSGGTGPTISGTLQIDELEAAPIINRAAATGPKQELGVNALGFLVGTANDGTTPRVAVSGLSYAGAGFILPSLGYETSGALSLRVNGALAGQTVGAPLLTMNNASAVFTVGRNFAGTSWFPGSICMVRAGATVPTDDGARWVYDQEKQMFQPGAQVALPDSSAIVNLDCDAQQEKWVATSATYVSEFQGCVRVSATPVPAGTGLLTSQRQGVRLACRGTTNPGVDITILPQNLKEELARSAGEAPRPASIKDWTGGFTATTVVGSALLTSVANLTIPDGCTVKGALVTGTGVPAGTKVLDYSGTTVQLSAAITSGAGSGVQINLLSFPLPTGMELVVPRVGGTVKQEGATKDFTRSFDGFREAPVWPTGSPPGNTAWVQMEIRRMAS